MAAGRLKIDIRRKRILELLAQNGQVTVAELSGLLNATQTTIRTDLDTMAAENRLVRIPGGAIAIPAQPVQTPVQEAAPENYGIPWEVTSLKCDLFTGLCRYATEWHPETDRGRMIHWSTRYTKKPLYRFEAEKLHLMVKNNLRPSPSGVPLGLKDTILYRWRLRYDWLLAWEFTRRAVNKLCRIVTRTPPKD